MNLQPRDMRDGFDARDSGSVDVPRTRRRTVVVVVIAAIVAAGLLAIAGIAGSIAVTRPDPGSIALGVEAGAQPDRGVRLLVFIANDSDEALAGTLRLGYETPDGFRTLQQNQVGAAARGRSDYEVRLADACGLRLRILLEGPQAREASALVPCRPTGAP